MLPTLLHLLTVNTTDPKDIETILQALPYEKLHDLANVHDAYTQAMAQLDQLLGRTIMDKTIDVKGGE